MTKTIVQDHQENFETLQRAFKEGQVCLMDCIEKSTGEHVAVICAVSPQGKEFAFTPFAKFFNGNPYELLSPPTEYDE
jgi:hypothetical protein